MSIVITKTKAAIAIVALALVIPATAFATHSFSDVPDTAFYHDAVEWALDEGITVGCNGGTGFCGQDSVTRGENITFAHRYDTNVVQPALEDLQASIDAISGPEAVSLSIGAGSFTGDGDVSFSLACSYSSGTGIMRASVPVPIGATITGFGGRFVGTGSDFDLVRVDAVTGSIGTVTTTSSSFDVEQTTLATPELVEDGEFFHLEWDPDNAGSSDRVCGALVHYTTPG